MHICEFGKEIFFSKTIMSYFAVGGRSNSNRSSANGNDVPRKTDIMNRECFAPWKKKLRSSSQNEQNLCLEKLE